LPARAEETRRTLILPSETHGIPPGFHTETRPRWGAIIGGGAVSLAGGLIVVEGYSQHLANRDNPNAMPGSGGEELMGLGVAHLLVGVPLLLYGLLSPREVYVRDSAGWSVSSAPGRVGELKLSF